MSGDRPQRVLSIYPNAHGLSYSHFEGKHELVDWGNIGFKNKNYEEDLQNLIDILKPEIIVTEDNTSGGSNRGSKINKVLNKLYVLTLDNNIILKKYSPNTVKGVFDCFEANNKYKRAILIASWFTELSKKLPPERKIWLPESYRMGVFDSVSYAITFFHIEG